MSWWGMKKLRARPKRQKYFGNVNVKVIVNIVIILSSSDDFSVATPDETSGKDTEFSLVGCFRNK